MPDEHAIRFLEDVIRASVLHVRMRAHLSPTRVCAAWDAGTASASAGAWQPRVRTWLFSGHAARHLTRRL